MTNPEGIMRGLLAAVAVFLGGNAAATTLNVYDTGTAGITTLPGDEVWYVLYSLDVSHVSAGDILLVTGEGQLTRVGNETKTLLSAELKLCNSTTDIVCSGGSLDEGNGINMKDDLAVGLPVKLSIRPFPTAPNSAYHYVNLLVHSNGSDFSVDPGRLQVLRISP